VSKWLTPSQVASLELSLWDRLRLQLWGSTYMGDFQPQGWLGPLRFYLVKDKKGLYISYPQGLEEVFYAPD
jgi:hypothetical protein